MEHYIVSLNRVCFIFMEIAFHETPVTFGLTHLNYKYSIRIRLTIFWKHLGRDIYTLIHLMKELAIPYLINNAGCNI